MRADAFFNFTTKQDMKTLWSPWRSQYIDTFNTEDSSKSECFICDAIKSADDKSSLVVARTEAAIILMNKYPYNSGHLLIAPLHHTGNISELSDFELAEINILCRESVKILKELYKPNGFNIGANLGDCAGAGLPGHIHYHVLPRWIGDTSFVSTISDIKVISYEMEKMYEQISEKFVKSLCI